MIELMFNSSGINRNALCELRFKDFDLDKNIVKISNNYSKEIIVSFTSSCLAALVDKSMNQMSISKFNANLSNYRKRCGINGKKIDSYEFRRCFARHLIDDRTPKVESKLDELGIKLYR